MKHISLKRHLLLGSIFICTVITLCISIIQISRLQQREQALLQKTISSFEQSVMASIREALWNYDWPMVETIAASQVNHLLAYIKICDAEGGECKQSGVSGQEPFQDYFRDVAYRPTNAGKDVKVGTVHLQLRHQPFGRLFNRYIFSEFLANGLWVFGVAISIFLLFHLRAIRRLVDVANYTRNIDLTAMEKLQPLAFDGNSPSMDEVDLLAESINGLVARVKEDFTRRKQLEQQLNHGQKMEALGTLAGGIAHDFNNILAAMLGYVQLCYNAEEKGSTTHNRLGHVLAAGDRATALIAQILIFSRKSENYTQNICFAEIVNEALDLVRATLPHNVLIETDMAEDLWMVGDSGQIHQILLNLVTNSVYELATTGGKIKISVAACQLESEQGDILGLDTGNYICVKFCDNGSGIPTGIRERIFDPFFTTKETGKGTGMGLAVVHGIVQAHGGRILLAPEVAKGVCFTLYFPQKERRPDETGSREDIPTVNSGGGEHLLLVDDEPIVLNMCREMLQSLGYQVSVSTSPVDALQRLLNTDNIDLLMTDFNMPKMTGVELAKALKQKKSRIPIILYSGNFDLLDDSVIRDGTIDKLLQKPFRAEELSRFVRDAIDG